MGSVKIPEVRGANPNVEGILVIQSMGNHGDQIKQSQ